VFGVRKSSGQRLAFGERAPGNLTFSARHSGFRWVAAVVVIVGFIVTGRGQSTDSPPRDGPVPKALVPYTTCDFPDGLRVVETDPLAPGVTSRTVETAAGQQQIDLVAAERMMVAYPLTDFFANVKAELLPAARYPELKKTLIDNLHFLEAERGGPTPARALPVGLHGFEVHGNDRQKIEGNVLGMYLLFDDKGHVATTIYFLNQQTWARKFQTMEEYGRLRDNFLRNYTGCVRENQAMQR
jgi:hypothetical protein